MRPSDTEFLMLMVQSALSATMVGLAVYNMENGEPAWFQFSAATFLAFLAIDAALKNNRSQG